MAEYIEREAIQKRLNRIVEVNNLRTDLAWFTPYGVNALIEEIPAADVRPVVLCRDCEMANPCADEREMYCTLNHCYKKNSYFCADGRRRNENPY